VTPAATLATSARLPAVGGGRRRGWLLWLVANGLARSLLAVAGVVALRWFVDRHAGGGGAVPAWLTAALLGAMALAVALAAALRWRETVDAEALAQHYIAHVRLRLFDRLAAMSPAESLRRSRGGVMLRFVGDAQALRMWIGQGIPQAVSSSVVVVVLLGALAWLAPAAAALVAAGWLLLGALAWHGLPRLCEATRVARGHQARVAANVQDKITGLPEMQVAGGRPSERRRLRRQQRRLRRALQRRARERGRLRALVQLAAGGTGLAVLAHTLWSLGAGPAGAGLGSALAAAALAGLLAAPLRAIGRAVEAWAGARVARERLQEFLAPAPAAPAPLALALQARTDSARVAVRCTLQWRGATLNDRVGPIDLELPYGRRVAIVGPGGSGKSALLALGAGLVAPDAGQVCLDGRPLAGVGRRTLHRRLALVAPELGALRGTLGSNLRYHRPDASAADLARAVRLSGLEAWLAQRPAGLDTPVRDAGLNLGQGERRALLLARALVGRPSVLLIDDAQASLPGDPAAALARLIEGFDGTLVYATTDPSLAALADEVCVLADGRLQEQAQATAQTQRAVYGMAAVDGPIERLH
jgi:ABC-type multidrug transport system fused ATPase/permease subunit